MSQVPDFINTLVICKKAYLQAAFDYGNARRFKIEFEGALPKRKGSIRKVLKRITDEYVAGPAAKMVIAAYDLGILDKHMEVENNARARKTLADDEGSRSELDKG